MNALNIYNYSILMKRYAQHNKYLQNYMQYIVNSYLADVQLT